MAVVSRSREILFKNNCVWIDGKMISDLSNSDSLLKNLQSLSSEMKNSTPEERQKIFEILSRWVELGEVKSNNREVNLFIDHVVKANFLIAELQK